jgi:hypothetical protein
MKDMKVGSLILILLMACGVRHPLAAQNFSHQGPETMYHVSQRIFFNTNGDLNGDFNGLRQKLGYLQQPGVTSLQHRTIIILVTLKRQRY